MRGRTERRETACPHASTLTRLAAKRQREAKAERGRITMIGEPRLILMAGAGKPRIQTGKERRTRRLGFVLAVLRQEIHDLRIAQQCQHDDAGRVLSLRSSAMSWSTKVASALGERQLLSAAVGPAIPGSQRRLLPRSLASPVAEGRQRTLQRRTGEVGILEHGQCLAHDRPARDSVLARHAMSKKSRYSSERSIWTVRGVGVMGTRNPVRGDRLSGMLRTPGL